MACQRSSLVIHSLYICLLLSFKSSLCVWAEKFTLFFQLSVYFWRVFISAVVSVVVIIIVAQKLTWSDFVRVRYLLKGVHWCVWISLFTEFLPLGIHTINSGYILRWTERNSETSVRFTGHRLTEPKWKLGQSHQKPISFPHSITSHSSHFQSGNQLRSTVSANMRIAHVVPISKQHPSNN